MAQESIVNAIYITQILFYTKVEISPSITTFREGYVIIHIYITSELALKKKTFPAEV
jgi:hypothetical protein